jgi:hypothetical protein
VTVHELLFAINCDLCKVRFGEGPSRFRLWDEAVAAGWKMCRRKDGAVAQRGGKDYCPFCAAKTFGGVAE